MGKSQIYRQQTTKNDQKNCNSMLLLCTIRQFEVCLRSSIRKKRIIVQSQENC